MECTQRLQCTQDVYDICAKKSSPEEIGFLGMCGSKYPIKKGPNKVGRDPQTCSIVLNDNSISRHHAVINILNKKDFMLMDLDSANKTKLQNRTLEPYIPHPLKKGDTVQFGQVFGIFRLLEEEDDLPMTQAVEIPDTPVYTRNVSRLKTAITTVPESPDDDSIVASKSIYYTSPNKNLKCPKKLSLEIHDMETQIPGNMVTSNISNVPTNLYSTMDHFNIFEAETQVTLQDKVLNVASTPSNITNGKNNNVVSSIQKKLNSSDEEICFDEIDSQQHEDECGSQPLLPPDLDNLITLTINKEQQEEKDNKHNVMLKDSDTKKGKGFKHNVMLKDSDTKDNEEIALSQEVIKKQKNFDEDVTDCEDDMFELAVHVENQQNKIDEGETDCEDDLNTSIVHSNEKAKCNDDDLTDCEDDIIEVSQNRSKISNLLQCPDDVATQVMEEIEDKEKNCESAKDDVAFEDMLTQVIEEYPIESGDFIHKKNTLDKSTPFEDLQTQVIDIEKSKECRSTDTKQIRNNDNFKRPIFSPKLRKVNTKSIKITEVNLQSKVDDVQNYYNATQEILSDLCTQGEQVDIIPKNQTGKYDLYIKKNKYVNEKLIGDNAGAAEKLDSFVSNLSKEQVREGIGTDVPIVPLGKKRSSDSSDLEVTPKKFNISKFLMIDLPNSQEIKSCPFITSKEDDGEYSDGLEDEDDTELRPQISNHKRRRKKDIKLDLMKKFNLNTLPTRSITRIRKPTSKVLDSDSDTKKMSERILQSKLDLDKEHESGGEIIELNSRGLRSKMKKGKSETSITSRKSRKHKNDSSQKYDQKEQSLRSDDKKVSKEYIVTLKTEKKLQQQNITSIFKASSSISTPVAKDHNNVESESIDLSDKSRRSSRSNSKSYRKEEIKLIEANKESFEKKNSSGRICSKETTDLTKDQQPIIRRSRRHQDKKDKIQRITESYESKNISSVIFGNKEISAVYTLSSETAVDSLKNLKRQSSDEINISQLKRAKLGEVSARTSTLRAKQTQYVLFTAFPSDEVKLKLEKLGAVIVSDVKKCTVVLTLQIKRTFKLLCAMGLGKPIVGPNWVQACADRNMIIDPWVYVMKDEATEKRFGFNLRRSLTCKRNFLKGYNIHCTPNVTPCAQEMKSIVECSGGTWKEGGKNWFCVTCLADKGLWDGLRKRGATLVSTEFILGGVLQQKINLDRDIL